MKLQFSSVLKTHNFHPNKNGKADVWREKAQGKAWGSCEGPPPQVAAQARSFSSVCTHAQPRVALGHTHSCCSSRTLSHTHMSTHTLALFCSKWQTFCRWLILYHVAPKTGKMSKRAYHWLQTYCLHCHINLIQKLSKGPLRFISAFAFIFIFEGRRDIPMIFSHVLHRLSAVRTSVTLLWITLHHSLGPVPFTSTAKFTTKHNTTNVKWVLPIPNSNHLQFIQFLTRNLNVPLLLAGSQARNWVWPFSSLWMECKLAVRRTT